jgi:hypothetical protein
MYGAVADAFCELLVMECSFRKLAPSWGLEGLPWPVV